MKERTQKIVITFRIDPKIKEAAKRCAKEAKQTLSRYVEELIKQDLWKKGMLGCCPPSAFLLWAGSF